MNKLQCCHDSKQRKVCLYPCCKFGSKFICLSCNQPDSIHHYNLHKNNIIDLEEIKKNQQILEKQRFQYHNHMHKINEIQSEVIGWKNKIKYLISCIKDYIEDYKDYIENLMFIQNLLDQNMLEQNFNQEIRKKLQRINDYNQQKKQQYLQNQIQEIQNSICEYQNNRDAFNINHTQTIQLINRVQVTEATISSNDKWLVYLKENRLYQYDINKQTTKFFNFQFEITIDDQNLSFIQDNELLCLRYSYNNCQFLNIRKDLKRQYNMISKESRWFYIIPLSKFMMITFYLNGTGNVNCKIINLKKNKIIYKNCIQNLRDFFYNKDHHIMIFVYETYIEQVQLNSKYKKYTYNIDRGNIIKSQYCQQSNKLVSLIENAFYFLDLGLKNALEQKVQQICFVQQKSMFFKYLEKQNRLILIDDYQITILTIEGKIINRVNHFIQHSGDLDITNYDLQQQPENYICLFTSGKYFCKIDSISLINLNYLCSS